MERIPPSRKIRQRIDELLRVGMDEADEGEITTRVIRLGVERLIQEML